MRGARRILWETVGPTLGKGEVESSILSHSTMNYLPPQNIAKALHGNAFCGFLSLSVRWSANAHVLAHMRNILHSIEHHISHCFHWFDMMSHAISIIAPNLPAIADIFPPETVDF